MTEPGWYHGTGDPDGTVRYWDGQGWAGEPTTDVSHTGEVFYAAPSQNPVLAAAAPDPHAAGGVTYKITAREEPVVADPAPPEPTPAIPASAQFVAIALSALKAIPLALSLLNTILVAVLGTIGLSLSYNEDLETLLALAIGFALLFVAIGVALLGAQALGAARNKPVLLLVPALILTVWDGLLAFGAWSNDHGTDHYFYSGLLLLQAWVVVGAIIGLVKQTP